MPATWHPREQKDRAVSEETPGILLAPNKLCRAGEALLLPHDCAPTPQALRGGCTNATLGLGLPGSALPAYVHLHGETDDEGAQRTATLARLWRRSVRITADDHP